MKNPVPWLGQCFVHDHSDDLYDYYKLDPATSDCYLKHARTSGMWLASIRGAKGCAERRFHGAFESDPEVARLVLDAALKTLRDRVASDQKWLTVIDEEIGVDSEEQG